MRIGIDARALQTGMRYQGMGIYTYNLIRQLVDEMKVSHTFVILGYRDLPQGVGTRVGKRLNVWRPYRRYEGGKKQAITEAQETVFMPIDCKRGALDLYHNPVQLGTAAWYPCPSVVTIHDVIPLLYPKEYLGGGMWMRTVYRFAARATRIITVSENSKRDIVEKLRVPPEKVTVTYEGVDRRFRPEHPEKDVLMFRRSLGLPADRRYLLFTAGMTAPDPRKNVKEFLSVFARLAKESGMEDLDLVIAGKEGPATPPIREEARRLGIEDRVIFVGFVELEHLPILYALASAYIFPSRYEGFGLPVLEAMASGCPVISSNAASLPEVVGDGGVAGPS
ncbi:MAG: glycosyltransferase family 4 protein, partial [Candidatus Methylomirabilis sp.]|nr:glycosyltransferase family 4 protein [Deltaproteobacteria bacterium]